MDILVCWVKEHCQTFFFILADPQHIGRDSDWIQGSALPDKQSWHAAWP